MIIRSQGVPVSPEGRKAYPLGGRTIEVEHFVIRVTTPDNPFGPHCHERPELWYIVDGLATVRLGEENHEVCPGDLVVIDPGVEHGLQVEEQATWICLG